MLVGYPEGVTCYKMWCLEVGHSRCFISRDVVFNEHQMANLIKKSDADKQAEYRMINR